jgi:PRD1 phage membrane DNA delivery
MGEFGKEVTTIFLAIIGVWFAVVLLSKNSNTTGVIQAFSGGFSGIVGAIDQPLGGGGGMVG